MTNSYKMKMLKQIGTTLLVMSVYWLNGQEIKVSSGVYVTVDDNARMVLNGMGLNNNGNFRALNGTLVFTGSQKEGPAYIGGSSPLTMLNLVIDRISGDLQLGNRIFVNGNLEFVNGNVDLNNYSIDLGSTGKLIGESRNARIIGEKGGIVRATSFIHSNREINPGNLGLQISSDDNLGTTTITRGHLQQVNKNGELSIERFYEIIPLVPVTDKMKVRAYFLDVESANYDPQELVLWSSADAGRNWSQVKTNSANYELTKSDGLNNLRVTYFTRRSNSTQLNNAFIQLYPNPVRDRFTINYYSLEEEDIVLNLYTQSGQFLEAKRIRAVIGTNRIEWSVSRYAAGNYQLRIINKTIRNLVFVKE